MARTAEKKAWIMAETTYGTDPDNDGSGYNEVPAFSIGEIPTGITHLETNYQTGRGLPTPPLVGPDGGSIEMVVPVVGLATEAGDGVAASSGADDWYDDFWENHVSDTPWGEETGEAIADANTTDITFDASSTSIGAQDLIAVYDGTAFPSRSQWTQIQSGSGAGPWVVEPDFATAPTTAGIVYGARLYAWQPSTLAGAGIPVGGSYRSLVVRDSSVGTYLCTGGRITSRSIVAEAGQRWEDRVTWSFDSITEDLSDKSQLSYITSAPAVTPLKCMLSPVWFAGTAVATKRIEINFNIEATPIGATSGTNGRAGWEIVSSNPTITIEPLATNANRLLFRNVTEGQLLIQIGAGVYDQGSSGVLNTCCFFAHRVHVMGADRSDDSGDARQSITFKVHDAGAFTGTTPARFWGFARA